MVAEEDAAGGAAPVEAVRLLVVAVALLRAVVTAMPMVIRLPLLPQAALGVPPSARPLLAWAPPLRARQ